MSWNKLSADVFRSPPNLQFKFRINRLEYISSLEPHKDILPSSLAEKECTSISGFIYELHNTFIVITYNMLQYDLRRLQVLQCSCYKACQTLQLIQKRRAVKYFLKYSFWMPLCLSGHIDVKNRWKCFCDKKHSTIYSTISPFSGNSSSFNRLASRTSVRIPDERRQTDNHRQAHGSSI